MRTRDAIGSIEMVDVPSKSEPEEKSATLDDIQDAHKRWNLAEN